MSRTFLGPFCRCPPVCDDSPGEGVLSFSRREEEAIQLDGLNAAQVKELREKSEKHAFQAEVNRMMKLIINSLYKNKEVSGGGGGGGLRAPIRGLSFAANDGDEFCPSDLPQGADLQRLGRPG